MRNNILVVSALAVTAIMSAAGCSSSQSIKTADDKAIVTSDKPQVDNGTDLASYKNAETDRVEQINRDQMKSMDGLDN